MKGVILKKTWFSEDGQRGAKCLTNLWETGTFMGKAEDVTVFGEGGTKDDGAGITYGKSQTTENSGGLHKLLARYADMNGAYKDKFAPYLPSLYQKGGDKSKKNALRSDMEFRELLIEAGKEDEIMGTAQDGHFHQYFFMPAMWSAQEFGMRLPMTLAFIYDFSIHSGPGSRFGDGAAYDRLSRWDDSYEAPDLEDEDALEKAWTIHMCRKRDTFLKGVSHASYTRYRTFSMLKLMEGGGDAAWELKVPLKMTFYRKDFIGSSDRHLTLRQDHLDRVSLVVPYDEDCDGNEE